MRLIFRRLFDRLIACFPVFLVRGLLKTFENHPELSLRAGFRLFPAIFDTPLITPAEINVDKLEKKRDLPGIQIPLAEVKELTAKLANYASELDCLPREPGSRNVIWAATYPTIDSAFLYCMIRHLKPRRYIEVGCGFSSRVSSMALRRNESEGHPCRSNFIEPFPGPRLDGFDLFGELLVKRVEDVPVQYFQELQANDILFIDTSHVIKTQNDVEYELLHILPALNKGVHVHIHDIYTPYDQPKDMVLGPGHGNSWGFRNEQYALECLLTCSDAFRVTLPLYLMEKEFPELIENLIPGASDRAQALWIVKA